jgi:hypothetical protein
MALRFLNNGYFAGNVGIGTDSPDGKLDVSGTAVSQYITSTSGGAATLHIGRSIDTQAKITSGDVSANDLCFYVNNSRRLVIANGGNVGIGTDSPDAKLHVEGGIGIFNVSDDWQQSSLGTYLFRGANFATTISNETSTLKIFPANESNRDIGNYWGGINFMHLDPENSTWGTAFPGGQLWIGGRIISLPGQELSALVFATNSSSVSGSQATEKMVILPNGNVGIGADDPSYQLSIENHATTTSTAIMELDGKRTDGNDGPVGELIFSNNGDTFATVVGVRDGADNSGSIVFQTQDSGTFGTRMTISSDGNVGIGVSNPETARLLVRGSTNDSASQIFQAANFGGATKYAIRADGDNKWYKSDNSLSMALTSIGNVLIGNTVVNPASGFATQKGFGYDASTGNLEVASTSGSPMTVGRNEADAGEILVLRKQATVTHSFGSTDSYLLSNVGIGITGPQSKLQVDGGIQMADDDVDAVAAKAGTMRYRTGVEYVEVTSIELVTNGDFATDSDWTKGTGWTISGGKANGASAGGDVTQAISIPINKTYRVNYTISNYSSGIFRIILGAYVSGTNRSANGTYTDILTVTNTSSNSLLYLAGDVSAVTLSIDNVSVMEVTSENASYADMCMQTGASTYEWVNIVRNTY